MKSKKAQGHVEIILSFIIFIGFLLFIFTFMNPFSRSKETSYIMDNIEKVIINEISDDVGKLSIIMDTTNDCYDASDINSYGLNYTEVDEGNRKYIIYYNDLFGDGSITSCDDGIVNYTLGTYSTEKMILYSKIETLKSVLDEVKY